jgi:hypothetical protein
MPYLLFIDDNFHYQDEEERIGPIPFERAEDALGKAREIVDDFLNSGYKPGMTADELYSSYTSFGDDPFIRCEGVEKIEFSAWDYARERCKQICG